MYGMQRGGQFHDAHEQGPGRDTDQAAGADQEGRAILIISFTISITTISINISIGISISIRKYR